MWFNGRPDGSFDEADPAAFRPSDKSPILASFRKARSLERRDFDAIASSRNILHSREAEHTRLIIVSRCQRRPRIPTLGAGPRTVLGHLRASAEVGKLIPACSIGARG